LRLFSLSKHHWDAAAEKDADEAILLRVTRSESKQVFLVGGQESPVPDWIGI
jgi:hypothetical protein